MTRENDTAHESTARAGGVRATYRLQMRGDMDFKQAARLVPYIAELGVSHLYLSPIFAAVPGSTHGYDVTDPTRLDPALGSEEDFIALSHAARERGLGLVLDFVPNHVAVHPTNPWFRDVLRWGPESRYACHFDIDFAAPDLLLGMLGAPYGTILSDGAFMLSYDPYSREVEFCYGDLRLPLALPSYAMVLSRADPETFASLARRYAAARPDQTRELGEALAALLSESGAQARFQFAIDQLNSCPEDLHAVHEAQVWRLAHWRAARDMLTYRRFFEISDLIGLTVERDETFADVHAKLLTLVTAGHVDGIRLDHIDGLADPAGYLDRLNASVIEAHGRPLPLYVEKILEAGERLPASWPAAGTTGYEFITAVADAMVDPAGAESLSATYRSFTGVATDFAGIAHEAKKEMLSWNLASELRRVMGALNDISRGDLVARDFGPTTLAQAIITLAAALPVYRTYVDANGISDGDRALLAQAVSTASLVGGLDDAALEDFLHRVLTLEVEGPYAQAAAIGFVTLFQQMTGPVMAKGVEDTAFYRFNRLVSLNEVGGAPDIFGGGIANFHDAMAARLQYGRHGLTATATHDTKRGEDARARIHAISEMPDVWGEAVRRWSAMNAPLKDVMPDGLKAPDANTEWLFYQTLVGSWPQVSRSELGEAEWHQFVERMKAYMIKAAREAKLQTSWLRQDRAYEEGVRGFVKAALSPQRSVAFLQDFEATCAPLFAAGARTSLAQALLKVTVPGVPDIYQGSELLDLSLVDPDNRRPPDWSLLAETQHLAKVDELADTAQQWSTGVFKFSVLVKALAARARNPDLFKAGDYRPLQASGRDHEHVVAFARTRGDHAAVIAVPRLCLGRSGDAASEGLGCVVSPDTFIALPDDFRSSTWRHVLTGDALPACDVLYCQNIWATVPVALLTTEA
jgi:(1->4)-alpha-D-glucan 1-alpha-D-glucosylmutase